MSLRDSVAYLWRAASQRYSFVNSTTLPLRTGLRHGIIGPKWRQSAPLRCSGITTRKSLVLGQGRPPKSTSDSTSIKLSGKHSSRRELPGNSGGVRGEERPFLLEGCHFEEVDWSDMHAI